MKKALKLSICLLLIVFCFTSCSMVTDPDEDILQIGLEYISSTDSYKLYLNFCYSYKVGMDKQEVLDKLGYPEIYYNVGGNIYRSYGLRSDEEREAFKEGVLDSGSTRWYYTCYKERDPAEPYTLKVCFDSEGKVTSVSFRADKYD